MSRKRKKTKQQTYKGVRKPVCFGIDWARGSGMIRGEVIKRIGNVIYVRFKTVEFRLS